MRVEQERHLAAMASYARAVRRIPRWYYNLLAHPYTTIQDGHAVRRVRAREVFDEEKQGWWAVAGAVNPTYDRYRATTGRDIPILALEPAESGRRYADPSGTAPETGPVRVRSR